jgi:hypothetical protein
MVDPGCPYLDQNLTAARTRRGDFPRDENFGATALACDFDDPGRGSTGRVQL